MIQTKDPDLNWDGKKVKNIIPIAKRSKALKYYYENKDELNKKRRDFAKTPEGRKANKLRNQKYRSKIKYESQES